MPPATGDLTTRLPRPGHPDGLGNQVGGAPGSFHTQLSKHRAGQLSSGAVRLLAFEPPHSLAELTEGEIANGVVEQPELAADSARRHEPR